MSSERDGHGEPGWLLTGGSGLARSHGCQRAGAKAQRQEAIWQGIHENLDIAISSGLSTFVQMRALATQARMCWRFTVLISSAKKKSAGSQEKAKKNRFVNIQKTKMCFSK